MKRSFKLSCFILIWVLFPGLILQAQDMGTADILSLSGRYGRPGEYKEIQGVEATEIGMLNALTAGFKLATRTLFAINVNHFYFHVKDGLPEPPVIASPIDINGIIPGHQGKQIFCNFRFPITSVMEYTHFRIPWILTLMLALAVTGLLHPFPKSLPPFNA